MVGVLYLLLRLKNASATEHIRDRNQCVKTCKVVTLTLHY